jgi:tubulin polyglutamylase TTLL5
MSRYQKINHFPCSFYITRKDLMYKTIAKLAEIHGHKHFMFLPKTYILPNEYQYLQQDMQRCADSFKQWIFKPAAAAQGRGIFVTSKLADIPQKNSGHNYVVSEYVGNPLLLNGYKFDLRIYVAVTSVNPLRFYMYEEGLARFATCKYDHSGAAGEGGQKGKFMHLTNYSINKKNAAF